MRRLTAVRALAAAGAVAAVVVALPALARAAADAQGAVLCVGNHPGCYSTIQAAVDAASDGDTIRILPGTYAGGITINVSVDIVGAGASSTIIEGGGPVILIGAPFPWSPKRPTISIAGVTVTGGVNNVFPGTAVAQGGGINITPSANPNPNQPGLTGATVTIRDSVVTGNQVYAQELIPPGFCGKESCAFASGAGIDSSGDLTLIDTRVSDNLASSPPGVATSIGAGGIDNHPAGTLRLEHSWVTGNRVVGGHPNAREGNAGGVLTSGPLTIDHSFVTDNTVSLSVAGPMDAAFAGGILVDVGGEPPVTASIAHTVIRGNRASATDVGFDSGAFGGGLVAFSPLSLSDSVVDDNAVSSTSSGGATAFADGGGAEIDGPATITDTLVTGNTVVASSPGGAAFAHGGGIANAGQLTLTRVSLAGNSVSADAADGNAQGGGLWEGAFDPDAPPPTLDVRNSAIIHNSASGSSGVLVQGGGVFAGGLPVTFTATTIAGNVPDQCFGC